MRIGVVGAGGVESPLLALAARMSLVHGDAADVARCVERYAAHADPIDADVAEAVQARDAARAARVALIPLRADVSDAATGAVRRVARRVRLAETTSDKTLRRSAQDAIDSIKNDTEG